jgi:hypothetical protein
MTKKKDLIVLGYHKYYITAQINYVAWINKQVNTFHWNKQVKGVSAVLSKQLKGLEL